MQVSEVSSRYAKALFDIATEKDHRKKIYNELKSVSAALKKDPSVSRFMSSQTVRPEQKKEVLKKALDVASSDSDLKSFVLLLAEKGRLNLLEEVIFSFQRATDDAFGVTRGSVRSAQPLSEEEQKAVEDKIIQVTGKKVILHYECDPRVVGGLIAEVGGYVFDDTIVTHLRKLKEDINRRAH